MKRFVSMVLAMVMVMCVLISSASAASFSSGKISKGTTKTSSAATKSTGVGTAAKGNTGTMTSSATFHFRVRKSATTMHCSEGKTVSGSNADFSLSTLKDGNGESLLRKGYAYKLNVTHSSKSSVSNASCAGTWAP